MTINQNKPQATLIERYGVALSGIALAVGGLAVAKHFVYDPIHEGTSQIQKYQPGENPFDQDQPQP